MVAPVLPLTPLLYPLTLGVTLGAAFLATALVDTQLPGWQRDVGVLPALVLLLPLLWIVSRMEHRLAQRRWFRWSRHALRLATFGFATMLLIGSEMGLDPSRDLIAFVADLASGGPPTIAAVVVMALLHVLLVVVSTPRQLWHRALEILRLRPQGLEGD